MLVRANKNKAIKIPSKKAMAAKLRRKAMKAPKHIYDKEKMPLTDAVAVLRVSLFLHVSSVSLANFLAGC